MANSIGVGIIGGGRPALEHAKGFGDAGGFKIVAVADFIPDRRQKIMAGFAVARQYATAEELLADKQIDAVSVCLPNDLHQPIVCAALRGGKHVVCESPPALDAKQARRMQAAAQRYGKTLLYALPRRFGGAEQAARQAIAKGYIGSPYHVRSAWMRTRGIPAGTGWYTDKSRSGGGAMIDLGLPMLDLAWCLLGQPKLQNVSAVSQNRFGAGVYAVEDAITALLRFEEGKTIELSAAWAINQPPHQQGSLCRVHADGGALEVYTPQGATLYRHFSLHGESKAAVLKPPKTLQHAAMMRHFRQCIVENTPPDTGAAQGVALMEMVDAIYQSAESGKGVMV